MLACVPRRCVWNSQLTRTALLIMGPNTLQKKTCQALIAMLLMLSLASYVVSIPPATAKVESLLWIEESFVFFKGKLFFVLFWALL